MKQLTTIILIIVSMGVVNAQQDSTILSFDEYYSLVINNHPIVKQAQLLSESAAQEVRLARGSFDPKLEGSWDFKEFKDSEYYNKLDVSLKIPTWFPVNPVVGVERNLGSNLNPESFIAQNTDYQQVYAGVSVPIGQGLFIDQRRATLRKAQLLQDMAEADQIKEINKILLTATKDYWEWYFAYNNYALLQRSIALAQDIFNRTKMAYDYGEAAPIDTVQAKINLLNRITAMQQANIERVRAGLNLSNHLWAESGEPLELEVNVIPEKPLVNTLAPTLLAELLDGALENHPDLRKLDLKNQSLIVDRRLARENIKPKLNLNYYLLDQPFDYELNSNELMFDENYKVGVEFSIPVFLRKERAKLKQTNIYLKQNAYQIDFTQRQILNEINAQYNEAFTTASILKQQQEMVNNYELLLQAERLNLENGESDLFKLNVQMDKLIESQSKLIKLQAAYQKDVASLYWAAGITNLGRE